MAISQHKLASETFSHYSVSFTKSESGFAGITDLLMADPEPTSGATHYEPYPMVKIPSDEDIGETNATTPNPAA